jgi:diguanylate cyclase (GGDEF)-like protein
MGIKIFFLIAIIYALISSIGLLNFQVPGYFLYVFLIIISIYFLFYNGLRKIRLFHTLISAILVNGAIQMTGGLASPLFVVYALALPIIGYKEKVRNYWITGACIFGVETLAAVFRHQVSIVPIVLLALAIVIFGLLAQSYGRDKAFLKKSLVKYEARDDAFRPADFDSEAMTTTVEEIDQHKGVARPLFYYLRFVQKLLDGFSIVFFTKSDENLVLVNGFSRSELFRTEVVVSLRSGIYRQIMATDKTVLIKEFYQDPRELGYYKGELKIASVMIAPIILIENIEGVLVIDRKDKQFDEHDKDLFDEAAKTAGYMLGMIQLYEKQWTKATNLDSIADFAQRLARGLDLAMILPNAITSFQEVLKCNDVSIAEIDELNEYGTVIKSTYIKEDTEFPLDDGLVGLVARHRKYIIKEDLSQGKLVVFKKNERTRNLSFIGVPIMQDDHLLGVLWCEDSKKKRFSDEDVEPVNILASHLSLVWQRAIHHEQEKEKAALDGLTGLYNHRQFHEFLQKQIDEEDEVVLLMLDIDHFKLINDTYGHQGGDKVIKALANLISRTGIAARYGGEEFVNILPGISLKKGIKQAVRIRDHLEKMAIKISNKEVHITISIGVAHYPSDAQTREELIEKADQALYWAKQTGRNKVVVANLLDRKRQAEDAPE